MRWEGKGYGKRGGERRDDEKGKERGEGIADGKRGRDRKD